MGACFVRAGRKLTADQWNLMYRKHTDILEGASVCRYSGGGQLASQGIWKEKMVGMVTEEAVLHLVLY